MWGAGAGAGEKSRESPTAPGCHTNLTSHSLLKDGQIARDNCLRVHCRCAAFGASSYCHPDRRTNVLLHPV